MIRRITIAFICSIGLLSVGFAQSSVVLDAEKDNTLYEDMTGAISNGAGNHMFSGVTENNDIRRAVVSFDISSIPAGSTIDSVMLTLNLSQTTSATQPVGLHRVLSAWGEGTSHAPGMEGGGDSSTTDDATWIHTFYDTEFWATDGGDYSPGESATQDVGSFSLTGPYTWGSTAGMVADVQEWLDNPSSNNGWILIGNEDTLHTSKRFDTKENEMPANRPSLTVYYTESDPCDVCDATAFQAKCVEEVGGTWNIKFRLVAQNTVIIGCPDVEFDVNGTSYVRPWQTNGTHSRALQQTFGNPAGVYTISLLAPDGCHDPIVLDCSVGGSPTGEWQDLDFGVEREIPGNMALNTVPVQTEILGNYPNPFNPTTTITYALANDGFVSLKIYNTLGQEVATLVSEFQSAGTFAATWNGTNDFGASVSSGIYLYRLQTNDVVFTGKMMFMK